MINTDKKTQTMVYAALFLALAYALPFLTGQIPEIGSMLCPMHVPVLLCGFICGWSWGLAVGFMAPLLRSLTLGMPVLFPKAVCMAAELAVYGAVAGIAYRLLPKRKGYIYCALVIAMLTGRAVWGGAMYLCMGLTGGCFTLAAFTASAFTGALPGIAIQLLLIPPIVGIVAQRRK